MFISLYKLKGWLNWPLIRAHLCTFAMAVTFSSTWRAPRDAFRYGGLVYGLILTLALVAVALPSAMLQLAIGQLSQQDAVGVWKAVPLFKGVGYLRLLISMIALMYTGVYVALIATYFLYAVSNSIPFWECQYVVIPDDDDSFVVNATGCFNETFLAPVTEKPEYYVAVSMLIVVLSTLCPFVLFSPFKVMKRILYVLGPTILLMGVIIASCIGDGAGLSTFYNRDDLQNMMRPHVWHGALIQSLMATHTYNGYLILAGDDIYSNTNVQWTALAVVATNVAACWSGLVFWYGISGGPSRDSSAVAVLVEVYRVAVEKDLSIGWPLSLFIMLLTSGIATMLILLYPVYNHCRRMSGAKWRYVAIACSVAGAAGSLAALAGGLPALSILEDVTVPLLINLATVTELLAFAFIYGWKTLAKDVQFLLGEAMMKFWVVGWFAAPCIIVPLTTWWIINSLSDEIIWLKSSWEVITLVATAAVAFVIFVTFAAVSVTNQMQYDVMMKLRASFRPTRHWGPRDPIAHHRWLSNREETELNISTINYRQKLGNLNFISVSNLDMVKELCFENKKRTNSDDWLYTTCRKKYLDEMYPRIKIDNKKRSKSLDCSIFLKSDYVINTETSGVCVGARTECH